VHFLAIALFEVVRHDLVEVIRCRTFPACHSLMHIVLKARQGGHDEEVTVEVFHCLFQQLNTARKGSVLVLSR
jgi:hypothetical protein